MTLRLYDTLTKQKQTLEDLPGFDRNNVRMYVCGPTVYDYAHIGNARPVIVFDVLFRLLRHLYGAEHVTYVRNITDIDDKINARAAEVAAAKGVTVEAARAEITAATAKQYDDDVAALGCLVPTHAPRATQYVPQMIAMIEALEKAGYAYPRDGHVLFEVEKKSDYGKLARRSLDEMIAGARVEVAPYKKNPMDFVLWKPSDALTPGWDSPWGRGRPGWHVECSAMGEALLGETFDIHGGGIDLMFPHHENEIAQSESAHHGHPLARVWMHNGFLQVEGEKMSKSLGNFVTIHDLLKDWPGEVLRFAMLMTHYREPINWTEERLRLARVELAGWIELFFSSNLLARFGSDKIQATMQNKPLPLNAELVAALKDDLNTPGVMMVLRRLYRQGLADSTEAYQLLSACDFLGLVRLRKIGALHGHYSGTAPFSEFEKKRDLFDRVKTASANSNFSLIDSVNANMKAEGLFFTVSPSDGFVSLDALDSSRKLIEEKEIESAITARNIARMAKNFKESDRIRDELLAKGIVLKDGLNGTTWEVKR